MNRARSEAASQNFGFRTGLRGKPGWGALGAVFTTVLNTFGATWWLSNEDGSIGASRVSAPEFATALRFYKALAGQREEAASSSYLECLTAYQAGEVAMWYRSCVVPRRASRRNSLRYDATAAAGLLEEVDSPVRGKNGYAQAPVGVHGFHLQRRDRFGP